MDGFDENARILELGCGTDGHTMTIAHNTKDEVTEVDPYTKIITGMFFI